MKTYIEIKADTDHVTKRTEISSEELEELLPIIDVIKRCTGRHNWSNNGQEDQNVFTLYRELLSEEQIDLIEEYIPYGENGIDTIKSILILEISRETVLL